MTWRYEVWEWDTYIADRAQVGKLMDLVFNKSLVNCKHEQPLCGSKCDVIMMSLAQCGYHGNGEQGEDECSERESQEGGVRCRVSPW